MMDVRKEIKQLKAEKNAIVLAHNYCLPEVQDIADFVGDSLALAIEAAETDADVIVFCGVRFMAEGAKIVNPEKTVLMPEPDALCPMASMCSPYQITSMRSRYPDAAVVGYVNSTAAAKTEMDICCTSANAVKVVESLNEGEVIFVPDANLGAFVQSQVPAKRIILWEGYCPTHQAITPAMVKALKKDHPKAEVLMHPECRPQTLELADFIGSTAGILKRARSSSAQEFIVGTEQGILHRLCKENPDKKFYGFDVAICPMMKMTDLESVLECLRHERHSVELDETVSERARISLQRMLQLKG